MRPEGLVLLVAAVIPVGGTQVPPGPSPPVTIDPSPKLGSRYGAPVQASVEDIVAYPTRYQQRMVRTFRICRVGMPMRSCSRTATPRSG